jgi:hypothetical protein
MIDPTIGWDIERMREEEMAERALLCLTCQRCKGFLKNRPDRTTPWQDTGVAPDGKVYVIMAGTSEYRKCSRCGYENEVVL